MKPLPVVVGFGGVSAAGRSSFHHSYHRTIYESLGKYEKQRTVSSLAALMGLGRLVNGVFENPEGIALSGSRYLEVEKAVLEGSLVRKISMAHFDSQAVPQTMTVFPKDTTVIIKKTNIPAVLPEGWEILKIEDDLATVQISGENGIKTEIYYPLSVQSAGQLPDGFEPEKLYKSRFHPRGLQLAVIGCSDAIRSIGLPWDFIKQKIKPDEIAVYSASAMAQLDSHGIGGMLQARLKGKRISSKQLALGLNTMPADFVNAYVLGNIGVTGANVGACATFLYNLRLAIEDIQEGRRRVVVVGNAEAPIEPEIIEGYVAMRALATDANLKKLDGSRDVNHRKASRPFGENCGFTLGESGQYFVLMDDSLAVELGTEIHCGLLPVFVSADGFKKSISAPGPGNYITLAKAISAAQTVFGKEIVRNQSFLQAHGSSTPQNRVSESKIFDAIAKAFGIHNWPVTAIKSFLGHSLAPASADQLTNSLGILKEKILPGIKTIDSLAPDVASDRLTIALKDTNLGKNAQISFLNSKGFGGNNATGTAIAPELTESMLRKRHGAKAFTEYQRKKEKTVEMSAAYDQDCLAGNFNPIYNFGNNLIGEKDIVVEEDKINIQGFENHISLVFKNYYEDMF